MKHVRIEWKETVRKAAVLEVPKDFDIDVTAGSEDEAMEQIMRQAIGEASYLKDVRVLQQETDDGDSADVLIDLVDWWDLDKGEP